jgi:hypothetical protein
MITPHAIGIVFCLQKSMSQNGALPDHSGCNASIAAVAIDRQRKAGYVHERTENIALRFGLLRNLRRAGGAGG